MHPKVIKQLSRSDTNFQFYSKVLSDLDPEQLNFRPDSKKWSILQTAYHLFLSESMIHKSIMKFSFEIKNEKLGMGAKFRSFLTNIALDSNVKFKAPTSQLEDFPDSIDAVELLEQWKIIPCDEHDEVVKEQ